MEAGMRALAASALVFGSIVAATSASATVYVPGQFKNGIYIRPHFLDSPDQVYDGTLLVPPDPAAIEGKEEAPSPVMLEPQAVPQKRRALPAS
jgi:hypothetical protein